MIAESDIEPGGHVAGSPNLARSGYGAGAAPGVVMRAAGLRAGCAGVGSAGAQQDLVALAIRLRLAAATVDDDPAKQILGELQADAAGAREPA